MLRIHYSYPLCFRQFSFDDLYNHLAHAISLESEGYRLCEETIPQMEFFLARVALKPNSVLPASLYYPKDERTASPATVTMHNSSLAGSIACPEAATVIISILSALLRTVSCQLV